LFIKSQFAAASQNFFHLNQFTQGHVVLLQKSRGESELFGKHKKLVREASLHFQWQSNKLGFSNVP
jgi:hypothetical protein